MRGHAWSRPAGERDTRLPAWLVLAVLVATMLGFAGSTLYSQRVAARLDESASSIATDASPAIEHLTAARGELVQIVVAAAAAVEPTKDGAGFDPAALDGALARLHAHLAAYQALPFYPRESQRYAETQREMSALETAVADLSVAVVARHHTEAGATFRSHLLPAASRVDRAIQDLVDFNARQQHRLALEIPKRRHLANRIGYGLQALTAALGLLLMGLVIRGIRHYGRLLETRHRMAAERARDVAAFGARLESIIASSVNISRAITTSDEAAGVLEIIADEARVLVDARYASVGSAPPEHPPLAPFLSVPIVRDGENVANLYLGRDPEQPPFTREDERAAELLASYVGVAIGNGRLYRRAIAATRARDDLLATVSHDLKNPLNAIGLAAGMLRAAPEANKTTVLATRIDRSVARMTRLIEDLLDAAKIEAGALQADRRAEDAAALVESAVDMLRVIAEAKQIRLVAGLPGCPITLSCERHLILRVLANLIGNAIKFSPEGSSIVVTAEPLTDQVRFSVRDAGPGIPADVLPHAFDRYWQQKTGDRRGSGLGLYIAKGIVEAHGGTIWIDTAAGRGTTVGFAIPTGHDGHDAVAGSRGDAI